MTKYSKKSLKKLKLHIEKLNTLKNYPNNDFNNVKTKTITHLSTTIRNKNLIKTLLTELVFFNFKISKLSTKNKTNKSFVFNKKLFVTDSFYKESFLIGNKSQSYNLIKKNNFSLFANKTKITLNKLVENNKKITTFLKRKNLMLFIIKRINQYSSILKKVLIQKWYIYIARFLIISLLHFIPFVQLITTLLYTQPNKLIVQPIISYLFNLLPGLVPLINLVSPILNQDTISFLILVPYLYFFIYSFKRYNISRKIAYQGSFALALMLFRYSLLLSQEALSVLFKFAKRFFFLTNYQNIELLRDDMKFYIDDLEDLRMYREEFFQLGESIFSLQDVTKVTKIWEATTIFSLLAVIALFYNYMYFIFRGKKPIIPVVTTTVQRMMIDRNSKES